MSVKLLYVEQWAASHVNTKVKVEAQSNGVVHIATSALRGLQQMYMENMASVAAHATGQIDGKFFTIPADGHRLADLVGPHRTRFNLTRMPMTKYHEHVDTLRVFINELRKAVNDQVKFVAAVQSDSVKSGTLFIDRADTHMSSARLYVGIMCANCGEVVNSNQYSAHLESAKCAIDTMSRDVRDIGFSRVDDNRTMQAIKAAGVKYELRPSGMDMWAPPWVAEAIQAWVHAGGFGDLSLEEYISRMNPESKDE